MHPNDLKGHGQYLPAVISQRQVQSNRVHSESVSPVFRQSQPGGIFRFIEYALRSWLLIGSYEGERIEENFSTELENMKKGHSTCDPSSPRQVSRLIAMKSHKDAIPVSR